MELEAYGYDKISIHALREEGDELARGGSRYREMISIHALREEGDRLRVMSKRGTWLFLSTPSARRATVEGNKPEE